jgi:hypothetical protein
MNNKNIYPIEIDCKKLREQRQEINNKLLLNFIKQNNLKEIKKNSNQKELKRILVDLNLPFDKLLEKCKDEYFAKLLVRNISINASRQGIKDESYILKMCSNVLSKIGVKIEQLSTTDFRAMKTGKIITNSEYKKLNLKKNDCLKSFDAKIMSRAK